MHFSDWLDANVFALAVVLFLLVAIGGPFLVQRLVPLEGRRRHDDLLVAGSSIVGIVNAVLLAFIVFAAWTTYDRAKDAVNHEADAVSAIARDLDDTLGVASLAAHDGIVAPLHQYVEVVIAKEWPAMARGLELVTDTNGRITYKDMGQGGPLLRKAYGNALNALNAPGITPAQKLIGEKAVARFDQLYDARRDRIGFSTHGSLSDIVWIVVLVGGVATVAFCALYGFESRMLHYITTMAVALCFALVFYLIMCLDSPFRGAARIGPDDFERAKRSMDNREIAERLREQAPMPR